MNIPIKKYIDGTALVLTTDSPAARYGIPVLRHEGCSQCADMGPADPLPLCAEPQEVVDLFGTWTAAEAVYYADNLNDLPQKPLCDFLHQWPEGPQLDRPHQFLT